VRASSERALAVPEAARFGFSVREVQIMFHGLCADCTARKER
jgi:Fe2+ or Zn2+ uptake regulation protein